MALDLPLVTEMLIVWMLPNIFFSWKLGGGSLPQPYYKWNGQYASKIIAYLGSLAWLIIVNQVLYPRISDTVNAFYAGMDPQYYSAAYIVLGLIGFYVYKRERWL